MTSLTRRIRARLRYTWMEAQSDWSLASTTYWSRVAAQPPRPWLQEFLGLSTAAMAATATPTGTGLPSLGNSLWQQWSSALSSLFRRYSWPPSYRRLRCNVESYFSNYLVIMGVSVILTSARRPSLLLEWVALCALWVLFAWPVRWLPAGSSLASSQLARRLSRRRRIVFTLLCTLAFCLGTSTGRLLSFTALWFLLACLVHASTRRAMGLRPTLTDLAELHLKSAPPRSARPNGAATASAPLPT
ncbi:hypothetical protein CDCA_CDCA16G4270 [Cyanidium caldarium]|uniref:PRA1 family protein n=1 Tax=Cyanidium caldarium TaxID=2771 RepID=A0AAV9J1P7_CYACA|nr:hypothetical protein CDCA_CDCA16G4270 [Cyanidium caldarium]